MSERVRERGREREGGRREKNQVEEGRKERGAGMMVNTATMICFDRNYCESVKQQKLSPESCTQPEDLSCSTSCC